MLAFLRGLILLISNASLAESVGMARFFLISLCRSLCPRNKSTTSRYFSLSITEYSHVQNTRINLHVLGVERDHREKMTYIGGPKCLTLLHSYCLLCWAEHFGFLNSRPRSQTQIHALIHGRRCTCTVNSLFKRVQRSKQEWRTWPILLTVHL